MPLIHRDGDSDSDGNIAIVNSPDVFVENQEVHRDGDIDSKSNIAISGRSVFANNEEIVTDDDVDSAGHLKITAASRTYVEHAPGPGTVTPNIQFMAAISIGQTAPLGLSEEDSAALLEDVQTDNSISDSGTRYTGGGSTAPYGPGPIGSVRQNEYGEAYNGVNSGGGAPPPTTPPPPSRPIDPNATATPGSTPEAQAGGAGPSFNNYPAIEDDNLLRWGVYAREGRQVDPGVLEIARAMARAVGTTLTVNSGYRSGAYNASLDGAATNSNHMYGIAMDVSFGNLSDAQKQIMLRAAIEAGVGGIGIYPEARNNFIHVDIGTKRTWRTHPEWSRSLMRSAGYI